MASGKEIRTKVASIKSTQKITRAMEMVAASKMRKAQEQMRKSRPYAEKIREVISHLAQGHPEYHNTYMIKREIKRVGIIIISSDRGLCGGLNINLFREILDDHIEKWEKQKIGYDICTIGRKANLFFGRYCRDHIITEYSNLGDAPRLADVVGTVKTVLDNYKDGKIDHVLLAYNRFVNTMIQKAHVLPLVPIQVVKSDEKLQHYWDYIYEPDAQTIVDTLLKRYIESLVYQAMVENISCEQAARMVAMKSASDNAGELIDELQLIYNKARQASITQELSEIVSGAAAV